MLSEVIREPTAIKETNSVTSQQILCWAKRVEVQKALLEATKENNESKEFDAIKKAVEQNHSTQNTKEETEGYPKTNTVAPYVNHEDFQPTAITAQDVADHIISSRCTEAQAKE